MSTDRWTDKGHIVHIYKGILILLSHKKEHIGVSSNEADEPRAYYMLLLLLLLSHPVVSNSVRPHRRQPTRLPRPWDSQGKNTGVGCHFLLQCMKVKNESEVAQSCPTLSDAMDCSPPGSSIHGIFQARVLEWGATLPSQSLLYRVK